MNMFPLFWRYFDDEDDAASSSLEYIPAPGSPSYKAPAQDSDSDNDRSKRKHTEDVMYCVW